MLLLPSESELRVRVRVRIVRVRVRARVKPLLAAGLHDTNPTCNPDAQTNPCPVVNERLRTCPVVQSLVPVPSKCEDQYQSCSAWVGSKLCSGAQVT